MQDIISLITGPTEVELVRVLWQHPFRTSLELTMYMQRTRTIAWTTVNAKLTALTKKGVLTRQQAEHNSRSHTYTLACTKTEYLRHTADTLITVFMATPLERAAVVAGLETSQGAPKLSIATELLGPAEHEVMLLIWQGCCTTTHMMPKIQEQRDLTKQSVNSTLARLVRKGLLVQTSPPRKRPQSYKPAITKVEYLVHEVERLLSTLEATADERAFVVAHLR